MFPTDWDLGSLAISVLRAEDSLLLAATDRAGLTIRGPHTNVRRGPFSHTRSQDFLWGYTFSPKKLTTFFSRRYV